MFGKLRRFAALVSTEIHFYRRVLRHPRTPRRAKWLLGLATAYLVTPIDLIPDGLPVIGHLDDLLIVPGLIFLAIRLVPRDVIAECRRDTSQPPRGT